MGKSISAVVLLVAAALVVVLLRTRSQPDQPVPSASEPQAQTPAPRQAQPGPRPPAPSGSPSPAPERQAVEPALPAPLDNELPTNERERIAATLDEMCAKADRRLERLYEGITDADEPDAAWRLREAEHILASRLQAAYRQALDDGSFVLVENVGQAPGRDGVSVLNLGAMKGGKPRLMRLFVDEQAYGVAEVRRFVEQRRRDWASVVAAEFNARPHAERVRLVSRYRANRKADRAWRDQQFPAELQLDASRLVLVLH